MNTKRIAELRAIAAKATLPPWRTSMTGYSVKSNDPDAPIVAAPHGGAQVTAKQFDRWLDNSDFIASARTALPEALDEVERLQANRLAVGELLAENGCDCECEHHHEEHDAECERCLACRISAALDEKGGG